MVENKISDAYAHSETPENNSDNDPDREAATTDDDSQSSLVVRSLFGGTLMGLANLVPGISGGTMLLAAGIYPRFIDAIAELTRFKFRFKSLLVMGCVVLAAGLAIVLLAGVLKDLVVHHRWIMYSLFIGLTLGGVPIVWRMARPGSAGLCIAGMLAFLAMVSLAVLQSMNIVGTAGSNFMMMFVAGLAGASAMILPGISGGYLLLLLGQYVPILSAIDQTKDALKTRDFSAVMDPAFSVILPVGLGVVIGIAVVGNLLQWLLSHQRKATLGALLGLLLGSTVGLWPFQQGVQPKIGDTFKAQVVTAQSLAEIDREDWPTKYFRPSVKEVGGAIVLVFIGFGITLGVSRLGNQKEDQQSSA